MRTQPVFWRFVSFLASCVIASGSAAYAAPAELLFEDTFDRGIPGWTAVQPAGATYIDGPLRWQYDIVSNSFIEKSNIYTDAAAGSPTQTSLLLVNDAVAPDNFTFTARLLTGDDDGFGLIFGYKDPGTFYRVIFARQAGRTIWPFTGWNVDRRTDHVSTNLFGAGTAGFTPSFINTQGRPFDVTIGITNGLFSLTVVDDPLVAPFPYVLVDAQPLPAPAGGQVGLTTWGMSGALPHGFHISDLSLAPVALVGDPRSSLAEWTPVLPPRNDGTAVLGSGNAAPIWSLALGANGPYGSLQENGDTFGGNDAAGQVDFVAPTVVAGDTNWTDYVLATRITVIDDDGQGVLLRYQNETNFYRIALRRQSSNIGVPRGLSVQKMVDGFAEEVFREATPQFTPQDRVPYDLFAAIKGNQLQIVVISNPTANPQAYVYGPIEITGAIVNSGKIGLLSWAMSRTEFDWVRVYNVAGVALQITSPFGNPQPPAGLHSFAAGSQITASVTSPIEDSPGTRRIATGWTGFGSVPAAGSDTIVTFTLDALSFLNWGWRTEHRLLVSAGEGGTVNLSGDSWLPAGTNLTATATPNPGYLFAGWSGDSISSGTNVNLTLNGPVTLAARFEADSDNDSLADAWEQQFFGNLSRTGDEDSDQDQRSNLLEFRRGTNPSFAESVSVTAGLPERWENVQRDPALPGRWGVQDFGQGYRGAFDTSNDFRDATDTNFVGTNILAQASFQGARLIVRSGLWSPTWTNYVAEAIFTVGDDDGSSFYFRYQDELNWYRVSLIGQADGGNATRPPLGVSVQKRVNGTYSEIVRDDTFKSDPTDVSGFKRIRVTVVADGSNFNVTVTGWDTFLAVPDWSTTYTVTHAFTDTDLPEGRIGFGSWGQGQFSAAMPDTSTALLPIPTGVLFETITVKVGQTTVFQENWATTPLRTEWPAGWTNPFVGGLLQGVWEVSAHGSIAQQSNAGGPSSGTALDPKADTEGPILLAPDLEAANYSMEVGFHAFDNDGVGFVYDFIDTNNYARVLFVNEATADGRVPRGLSISRKSAGQWSDVVAGDTSFVFQPGNPFAVHFANNNGAYRLVAWETDQPGTEHSWTWSGASAQETNRFGLTTWGAEDAHFLWVRASALPAQVAAGELRISGAAVSGGNITLQIANSTGGSYDVQVRSALGSGSWETVATGQTGAVWTGNLPNSSQAFYRLRKSP